MLGFGQDDAIALACKINPDAKGCEVFKKQKTTKLLLLAAAAAGAYWWYSSQRSS